MRELYLKTTNHMVFYINKLTQFYSIVKPFFHFCLKKISLFPLVLMLINKVPELYHNFSDFFRQTLY
jgi:hypothetical protein